MSGNNCEHSPENPRWFSQPKQHSRPAIINRALEKIRSYYAKPASVLPSLNFANGSDRQQRSERRESCLIILACLLHYLDLATLRVGIPQADGSFQGISMAFIIQRCGLNLRRAERALADLVTAGLITVHPYCEKLEDGAYKGFAAIRTLDPRFFTIFGLDKWLKHERAKAAERQKKRQSRQASKGQAQIGLMLKKAARNFKASANETLSAPALAFKQLKEILNNTS